MDPAGPSQLPELLSLLTPSKMVNLSLFLSNKSFLALLKTTVAMEVIQEMLSTISKLQLKRLKPIIPTSQIPAGLSFVTTSNLRDKSRLPLGKMSRLDPSTA